MQENYDVRKSSTSATLTISTTIEPHYRPHNSNEKVGMLFNIWNL